MHECSRSDPARARYGPGDDSGCAWSLDCRRCFCSGGFPPQDHDSDADALRMLLFWVERCAYVRSPVELEKWARLNGSLIESPAETRSFGFQRAPSDEPT